MVNNRLITEVTYSIIYTLSNLESLEIIPYWLRQRTYCSPNFASFQPMLKHIFKLDQKALDTVRKNKSIRVSIQKHKRDLANLTLNLERNVLLLLKGSPSAEFSKIEERLPSFSGERLGPASSLPTAAQTFLFGFVVDSVHPTLPISS